MCCVLIQFDLGCLLSRITLLFKWNSMIGNYLKTPNDYNLQKNILLFSLETSLRTNERIFIYACVVCMTISYWIIVIQVLMMLKLFFSFFQTRNRLALETSNFYTAEKNNNIIIIFRQLEGKKLSLDVIWQNLQHPKWISEWKICCFRFLLRGEKYVDVVKIDLNRKVWR